MCEEKEAKKEKKQKEIVFQSSIGGTVSSKTKSKELIIGVKTRAECFACTAKLLAKENAITCCDIGVGKSYTAIALAGIFFNERPFFSRVFSNIDIIKPGREFLECFFKIADLNLEYCGNIVKIHETFEKEFGKSFDKENQKNQDPHELYCQAIEYIGKIRLSDYIRLKIGKRLDDIRNDGGIIGNFDGYPGFHAEVLALNDLICSLETASLLGELQVGDLVSSIVVATFKTDVRSNYGKSCNSKCCEWENKKKAPFCFAACSNCSNIVDDSFVITGFSTQEENKIYHAKCCDTIASCEVEGCGNYRGYNVINKEKELDKLDMICQENYYTHNMERLKSKYQEIRVIEQRILSEKQKKEKYERELRDLPGTDFYKVQDEKKQKDLVLKLKKNINISEDKTTKLEKQISDCRNKPEFKALELHMEVLSKKYYEVKKIKICEITEVKSES